MHHASNGRYEMCGGGCIDRFVIESKKAIVMPEVKGMGMQSVLNLSGAFPLSLICLSIYRVSGTVRPSCQTPQSATTVCHDVATLRDAGHRPSHH